MAINKTLKKKTLLQLKAIATKHFNKFIRDRDKDKPCISCGKHTTLQAGHFYSAGKHSSVRFNEDNVHGQCVSCNYFKSGDLLNYRTNLIEKIGVDRFEKLTLNVMQTKQTGYKFDRFFLIEVIEKYKALNKLQILLPLIF
tara:strand:+ start:4584 stop:5006 length:423 start_codon:yes stop_codon:yes gene_type:complete